MGTAAVERRFFTPEEFAKQTGRSRWRIYQAIKRGDLPAVKMGRSVLIPADAIEDLVEQANAEAAQRREAQRQKRSGSR